MFKLCVLIGLLFVLEACLARPGSAPENGRRRPAPRRGPPPPPPPRRGPPPPPRRRPPPRRAPPPPPPPPPPPAYYYGTEPPMAQPYYEGSCSCNRGVEYCQPGEYKQAECEDGVVCCGGD